MDLIDLLQGQGMKRLRDASEDCCSSFYMEPDEKKPRTKPTSEEGGWSNGTEGVGSLITAAECREAENLAEQQYVSEVIRSLEVELGISEDMHSSLYQDTRCLSNSSCWNLEAINMCSAEDAESRDDGSAESSAHWEEDCGDSRLASCSSGESCRDEFSERSEGCLSDTHVDFSFLCDILDDQLGLLQDPSCETLEAFTNYSEGDAICSFQSLSEDSYACTILDDDIWGLSVDADLRNDCSVSCR